MCTLKSTEAIKSINKDIYKELCFHFDKIPNKGFYNKLIRKHFTVLNYSCLSEFNYLNQISSIKIRHIYIHYSFAYIRYRLIKEIVKFLKYKRVIEVGCDTGLWYKYLQYQGIDIKAIDNYYIKYNFNFKVKDIIKRSAVRYIQKYKNSYDVILMIWPPYNDNFAYRIWKNMKKGTYLLYIGEGYGEACANDKFFNAVEKYEINNQYIKNMQKYFVSFFGIHDNIYLFKKK